MNILGDFDTSKFYLGKLCLRQHEYQNTGKTLRRIKTRSCLQCHKIKSQEWEKNHPSRMREVRKALHEKHKEKRNARHREWLKDNAEHCSAWRKTRYRKHRDSERAHRKAYGKTERGRQAIAKHLNKRRAARKNNHIAYYSLSDWQKRLEQFDNRCAYCNGEPQSVDHFIAITKGGSHCLNNVLPACNSCNSSKHNKDPEKWYKASEHFSVARWNKILKVLGKTKHNISQLPLF